MEHLLQQDAAHRPVILQETLRVANAFLANLATTAPGRLVPDLPLDAVPQSGKGALETLRHFETHYAGQVTGSAGPRYFGFVTGGSTPAAMAGDWLVSAFDQNTCCINDSIAPQLERLTIHWLKQLFGLDPACYGAFVTGATMANVVGLALGRQWVGEQFGVDCAKEGMTGFPVKVLSGNAHASITKALALLGMGRNALVPLPTLEDREAVDVSALERYLGENSAPVIVVANAGTVNTGDFDDLEAIARLKNRYNFWLHTDAAFGGFAACSPRYAGLVKGIEHADSVTVDAHKWMNVPYDAAMQFTRHPGLQLKVFQNNSAAYLSDPETSRDFFHYTPESSRRWRALPVWFSLQAYGRNGHAEIVERNCALARRLAEALTGTGEFSVLHNVHLNIVCFTLAGDAPTAQQVQAFVNGLRDDGKVYCTPTVYKGLPAIRAAVSNWQTEAPDIDTAVSAFVRVQARLKKESV